MIDLLKSIDESTFLFLNGMHTSLFDFIMYWISSKTLWIPLYAIILLSIKKKLSWKNFGFALAAIAILILITDQGSVFIKETVQRYRPCHSLNLKELVHTIENYCGGQYGFFSSHAANTFGIAIFAGNLLSTNNRNILYALIIWASIVSYSRIYLGVHYPSDIITGGFYGALIGTLLYRLFSLRLSKS